MGSVKVENPQLNVLVFCPWAHGSSYYTAKFCNSLSAKGVNVTLIAPTNFMTELLDEEIQLINWPYSSPLKTDFTSLLRTPIQSFRLWQITENIKPDWIHFLWVSHIPIPLIPLIKKYKIAYTVHDPILHSGEGGSVRQFIQHKLVNLATIRFVHGQQNEKNLITKYNLAPKTVFDIPHGEFAFWEKIPDVEQEDVILFFGRIRKYKGLNILLDAFQKVSENFPGLRLFICGEGDVKQVIGPIESNKNIVLVNHFIGHNDIPNYFLRAKFLILPYTKGTQSGVIPMAFALGRTCIASNVGSIAEIVDHEVNGLLVAPSNVDELATAIARLLQDDDLRQKLEAGALTSIENSSSLSWDRTAKIAIDAYNNA